MDSTGGPDPLVAYSTGPHAVWRIELPMSARARADLQVPTKETVRRCSEKYEKKEKAAQNPSGFYTTDRAHGCADVRLRKRRGTHERLHTLMSVALRYKAGERSPVRKRRISCAVFPEVT